MGIDVTLTRTLTRTLNRYPYPVTLNRPLNRHPLSAVKSSGFQPERPPDTIGSYGSAPLLTPLNNRLTRRITTNKIFCVYSVRQLEIFGLVLITIEVNFLRNKYAEEFNSFGHDGPPR